MTSDFLLKKGAHRKDLISDVIMSANDQEGVRGDGRTSYEEAGRGSRKSYGESGRGGRKSYEEAGRGGRKEYDSEGRGSRNGGWRQKRKKADLTKEVNKVIFSLNLFFFSDAFSAFLLVHQERGWG